MDESLARAWVDGWVLSRGAAPPQEVDGGLFIDVGLTTHVGRYVLFDADEARVRRLTETVTAPNTWIKTFLEPETIGSWIADGTAWRVDDPVFLMSTELDAHRDRPAPAGYELRLWTRNGITKALIVTEDGSFAARAQTAAADEAYTVVFDMVETAAEHQRRGLGRWAMTALAEAAVARGARAGVLAATVEGRALYEALGWSVAAPFGGLVL
ncbi:MAG: GNAT family N-acetyltransferase [Hamadaea sp.]|uniref:GNAT family N-acetyltransferase n=1 Tax=Hamadaea sp. TaxID=2024425 RepID=UPI001824F51B|nr:GNAT family N-acetyltransferase [Hamadaea sp.]NUT18838.1 GNAT family N-acetyltransferase [Hamadaea sp.]